MTLHEMPLKLASAGSDEPVRRRYRLLVAYDGASYHGWQKQRDRQGQWLRTVQGTLEEAVIRALQQPITLVGASRTDAGVHALGQVAQFDAATRIPVKNIAAAINARLVDDIEVRDAAIADDGFNAIGQAQEKEYLYRIYHGRFRPLHLRKYVYHGWRTLDVDRMNAAAALLVGEHDFSAFASAGSPRLCNIRTIYHCRMEHLPQEQEYQMTIRGNGFLYNMVRIVAGTLLEVGRGAMPVEQVTHAIQRRDRRLAGPTLPPQGLWLRWIRYPGDPPKEQNVLPAG